MLVITKFKRKRKWRENENGGKTLRRRGQRLQGVFKCSEHTRTKNKRGGKETIKGPRWHVGNYKVGKKTKMAGK